MPGTRRNERGLTPKQMRALPIFARAATPRDAVLEIVKQKICAEHTYYADWQQDSKWIRESNAERDRYQGALTRRVNSIAIRNAENALYTMIAIAAGQIDAKPGQLAACNRILEIAGIDKVFPERVGENIFRVIGQRMLELQSGDQTPIARMSFGLRIADQQAEEIDYEDIGGPS